MYIPHSVNLSFGFIERPRQERYRYCKLSWRFYTFWNVFFFARSTHTHIRKKYMGLCRCPVYCVHCTRVQLPRAHPIQCTCTVYTFCDIHICEEIITLSYTYSFNVLSIKDVYPCGVCAPKFIHNGVYPQIWLGHIFSCRLCNGNKSFPGERGKKNNARTPTPNNMNQTHWISMARSGTL